MDCDGTTMVKTKPRRRSRSPPSNALSNKKRTVGSPQPPITDNIAAPPATTTGNSFDNATAALTFTKEDAGPFVLHLRGNRENNTRPLMALEVCRMLEKSIVKYDLVTPLTRNTWEITFNTRDTANYALTSPYPKQHGLMIWLPWMKVFRKGIIRGIPLDCSVAEIKEELNKSNPGLKVSEVSRLKRRIQKDGHTEWADTHTVSVVVRSTQLPKFVYIWRTRLDLEPFIPEVRRCFKCGRFGHISKVCKAIEKCLTCAHDKHPESETCATTPMCINCKGDHPTLNRQCPKFRESKEICRIMAHENVPFAIAQKQFSNMQHNSLFHSPSITFSNFPPLRHSPTPSKFPLPPEQKNRKYSEAVQARPAKDRISHTTPYLAETNSPMSNIHSVHLQRLESILKADPNSNALWNRIWKAIDLHIQFSNGQEPQRAPNTSMELPKSQKQAT